MKVPRDQPNPRVRRIERFLLAMLAVLSVLYLGSVVLIERMSWRHPAEFLPISLSSTQVARYAHDPITLQIPAARLELIAEVIHDQEPDADAAARFATVQANLLTPVAWLITPTPSRTPTPTRTPTATVTPTPTRTPDPWIALGQARVGCNHEVTFPPVNARQFKFQMIAGGGNNNHISFYCCGSNGAAFWVNGAWVHVTNPSGVLNVGEWRETSDFGGALVNRARFSIGCNDKEEMQTQIFYLPAPTPTPTLRSR